jgi:hypothetical protein
MQLPQLKSIESQSAFNINSSAFRAMPSTNTWLTLCDIKESGDHLQDLGVPAAMGQCWGLVTLCMLHRESGADDALRVTE